MAFTNAQLWDLARDADKNFASITSKATADLFTARGFEAIRLENANILNDFYRISLKVVLNLIRMSSTSDILAEQDFGESFSEPFGGIYQRIRVDELPSLSAPYKGLVDGISIDDQKVRKAHVVEEFYEVNFDYFNRVTIPDLALYKDMWTSGVDLPRYEAAIASRLNEAYINQKFENKLEALNAGINSVTYPLKDTQKAKVVVSNVDALTSTEIIKFIQTLRDIVDEMRYTPQTDIFNTADYMDHQDLGRLRILMRPAFANQLATISKLNSTEDMSLPAPVVKVKNFGGLKPYVMDSDTKVYLQPIYDADGKRVAYVDAGVTVNGPARYDATSQKWIVNVTSGSTTADTNQTVTTCQFEDPNEAIQAIIADKGVIFEIIQNPYEVRPSAPNASGMYQNLNAVCPNNTIKYDRSYNLITVSVTTS